MINGSHSDAYVDAAIRGEVARLGAAQPGERNNTLFRSAAALASLGLNEGKILHHLRPAAEYAGLKGKEFYTTVKSGVRAGYANLRAPEINACESHRASDRSVGTTVPPSQPKAPVVTGGEDGPKVWPDEIRRHVYRRNGTPVKVKIKRQNGGYVSWFRVAIDGADGWQARKPADYQACPYIGAINPFDPELFSDTVFWPEGEKDCDTLGIKSLPAFTFGGAGDGLPTGIEDYLRGRHLVILADNDTSGRAHALKKARLAHGIASSVKVVEFPELAAGGDVSDFLSTHSPEELEDRADQTAFWIPPPDEPSPRGVTPASLDVRNLSDVAPEAIDWLWPGRIAIGKLTLIGGEPGLGKSQVSLSVAAAVTTGGLWPLGADRAPLGNVIILSAEDGIADTVRPRFDAAGGDPARVKIVQAVNAQGSGRRTFNLAADLELLEREILAFGDVRLVLIDPISSYLGKVDSHKNADVRGVLEPLATMAERLRVGVLAITHLSKGEGKAINRIIGSIAFVAASRTAFAVVADPDDQVGRRLFLPIKNNIAVKQDGLAFRIAQTEVVPGVIGSYIAWESMPANVDVDLALKGSSNGEDKTLTDTAVDLLTDILSKGPANVLDIEMQARAAAILGESQRLNAAKPFRKAAEILGVVKCRIGFGPDSYSQWSLPGSNNGGIAS